MSERVHKESVDLDNKQVMLAALSWWRGYTLKTAKCGTGSLERDNLGLTRTGQEYIYLALTSRFLSSFS